jgi:hypothetical protein
LTADGSNNGGRAHVHGNGRGWWTRVNAPDTLPPPPKETSPMPGCPSDRLLIALALLAACTPKVAVEAPKEPITINMNIKIEHEIRIKVDKELDQLFDENDELF